MQNLIYIPFYNLLILFFAITRDMGVAVILLTVAVRVLLLRFSTKAEKSRLALQKLQPEIKKIQDQYKNDKELQTKKMLELYQKQGINPFSSCLPLLFQMPFLIGLLVVFREGLKNGFALYGPIKSLVSGLTISSMAFRFLDLTVIPNKGYLLILPIFASVLQYFQSKMMMVKNNSANEANASMNAMMLAFPVLTIVFLITFPAVLSIYWITTTLFGIFQQYWIDRQMTKESQGS